MKNSTFVQTTLKGLGLAALLWSVASTGALAGPEQDTELAEKEFARGDLIASMALWRKAALQGYAPAQARLGDILDKAEEDVEAVAWYRKAAEQGNVAGQYGLGEMYLKGEGVKKDVQQALVHILQAAEQGHVFAVVMMMQAYRTGAMGLAIDQAQSDAWESKLMVLDPGYKRAPAKGAGKTQKVVGQ